MSQCSTKNSFYGCMYDAQGNLSCSDDRRQHSQTVEHFYQEKKESDETLNHIPRLGHAKESLEAIQKSILKSFRSLGKNVDNFMELPR